MEAEGVACGGETLDIRTVVRKVCDGASVLTYTAQRGSTRCLRLRNTCSLPSANEPSISHKSATLNSGNKLRPTRQT